MIKAVCMGDSLTFGYGVVREHCWVSILEQQGVGSFINAGIPGNNTQQMEHRFLTDVIAHNPSHVFIMGGTNDVFSSVSLVDTLRSVDTMISMSREHGVEPFLMLPPLIYEQVREKELFVYTDYKIVNRDLQKYRGLLKNYSTKEKIDYIDVMDVFIVAGENSHAYLADGIHLTSEIHRQIAGLLSTRLDSLRKSSGS